MRKELVENFNYLKKITNLV